MDVFPNWLTCRSDFQRAFPRFSADPTARTNTIPMASFLRPVTSRTQEDKLRIAEWLAHSPVGRVTSKDRDFQDLLKVCSKLAEVVTLRETKQGDVLFRQGEKGDAFYLILFGAADVVVDGKTVARIPQGGSFGEWALITGAPRTATCLTPVASGLVQIRAKDYKETLASHQEQQITDYLNFLHTKAPVFREWSRPRLRQTAKVMAVSRFKQGDTIVKQGDRATGLHFLYSGFAVLQREYHETVVNRWPTGARSWETKLMTSVRPLLLRRLGPGDHFGDESLHGVAMYEFSVVAATEGEIFTLNHEQAVEHLDSRVIRLLRASWHDLIGSVELLKARADARRALLKQSKELVQGFRQGGGKQGTAKEGRSATQGGRGEAHGVHSGNRGRRS